MEDVDGMIGGLVELMEDAHIAMGKGGGSEDRIAEIILGDAVKEGINEYYIKRVEEKYFNGYICLVKMKNVKKPWIVKDDELEDCILDENYEWLEIYPDNEKYAITAMFDDNNNLIEWYFDMIKTNGVENGVPYIYDLYLDLVIKSNGKEVVLDEDELKEALNNRDISKNDFNMAYKTMKKIQDKYRNNLRELIELTNKLYKEL